jgi:hypothetical protein
MSFKFIQNKYIKNIYIHVFIYIKFFIENKMINHILCMEKHKTFKLKR